jgi:hypothetical protein
VDQVSRDGPSDDADAVARYGYFVLQARAAGDGGASDVNGVLEDLTTGDKQEFASAGEMARLLAEWAQRGRKGA